MAEGLGDFLDRKEPESVRTQLVDSIKLEGEAILSKDFAVFCTALDKDGNSLFGTEIGAFHGDIKRPDSFSTVDAPIPKNEVGSVCLSFKGEAYVAVENNIFIWDRRQASQSLPVLSDNTEDVNKVSLSPDELLLAAADDSGDTKIYDLRERKVYKTLRKGHKNICSCVSFVESSSSTSHVLTAGLDCQVVLWDFSKPKAIYTHNIQDSLSACGDSSVYMFNPPMVNSLWLFNDSLIACGLGNGVIEFLDLHLSNQIKSCAILEAHGSTGVTAISNFASDKIFLSGGNDAKLKVWESSEILKCRFNEKKKKRKKVQTKKISIEPLYSHDNKSKVNAIHNTEFLRPNSFLVNDQTNVIGLYDIIES